MIKSRPRIYFRVLPVIVLLSLAGALPLSGAAIPAEQFQTTSSMQDDTRHLLQYLERQHYLGMPLTELDQARYIEDYLREFDPNRLYLLQSDVNVFMERYRGSMVDLLRGGRMDAAFAMFLKFRERLDDRVSWIMERLEGDFDLTADEVFRPDREKLPWPASEAEADEIWERRLRYDLVNQILSALKDGGGSVEEDVAVMTLPVDTDRMPSEDWDSVDAAVEVIDVSEEGEVFSVEKALADAKEVVRKRYERLQRGINEIEPVEVQEVFLTALTKQYDPHSTYMSADTLEEFAIAMRNSLVGIGALLSDKDGYCTIRELLPGGPAERSGLLEPEDQILGVAQGADGEMVDVIGMKLNRVVKMIRGKKGTVVRLLIRPGQGDPSERREIKLVRDEIQLTAKLARAEVFDVPHGDETILIGVIDLPAFYGSGDSSSGYSSTTEDVEELILKLKELGVQGLVLDLRNNGGGLLSEAINLTGLFIPVGPVVQVRDYAGRVQEYMDMDPGMVWGGPLMVLISRYSASASEITAGALKNHGRALIVGDNETHGKGTVQAVFELNRSAFLSMLKARRGAAKITIQQYYLPDGTSTQIRGVNADIPLPSINQLLPIGEGDLPNALEWDSINALNWDYRLPERTQRYLINDGLVDYLRVQSEERQLVLDEFDYLNTNIDWFRLRQEQKEFSLNLEERRITREDDMTFRDNMRERLHELGQLNFDSRKVLLKVALDQQAEHEALVKERAEAKAAKAAAEAAGEDATVIVVETEAVVESAGDDDALPRLDIHLREGLRIMADWIALLESDEDSSSPSAEVAVMPGGQKG